MHYCLAKDAELEEKTKNFGQILNDLQDKIVDLQREAGRF